MNLFLDANVLVSVLNKELPVFTYSSKVLSLASFRKEIRLFTSPACLAIAYYFACKRCSNSKALKKIHLLTSHLEITDMGNLEVKAANSNRQILDYEDGLQYYSALHAGCTAIITENKRDFHFSQIPIYTSKELIVDII